MSVVRARSSQRARRLRCGTPAPAESPLIAHRSPTGDAQLGGRIFDPATKGNVESTRGIRRVVRRQHHFCVLKNRAIAKLPHVSGGCPPHERVRFGLGLASASAAVALRCDPRSAAPRGALHALFDGTLTLGAPLRYAAAPKVSFCTFRCASSAIRRRSDQRLVTSCVARAAAACGLAM